MEFKDLLGKTLVHVAVTGEHDDEVLFETTEGKRYRLFHNQDCCENVRVEDVTGDMDGLLGEPLVMAEEVTNESEGGPLGSQTWTFYKLATAKEYVTIRWLGESNGYYSERVDFGEIT